MRIGYGFWAKTLSLFLQTTGIFSGRLEHAQFFSFIPSKSSIDFKGSNRQLKEDISKRNMVCSEETPFDSYYMPEKNQGHIQLTRGNANFILNEINKKPQDPTYRLDANSIQGQGLLCDGSVQIFSVPNCKKDPGITLQASPDLKVLAQGSGSITVQAGGQNGKSWIKAFDRNGHLLGQKDIWVGKPRFELDLYSESELFYSIQEIIVWGAYMVDYYRDDRGGYNRERSHIEKDQHITSVDWYRDGILLRDDGPRFKRETNEYDPEYKLEAIAVNACGIERDEVIVPVRQDLVRHRSFPTQEILIQSYIIYDLLGTEVKRKSNPSPMEDPLVGLPLGQYIIKYQTGGRWHKESVFVK